MYGQLGMAQGLKSLFLGILIVAAVVGCAPRRYYGGDSLDQTVIARGERDTLLSDLRTRLQTGDVPRLSVVSGAQRIEIPKSDFTRASLSRLSTPALAALRMGMDKKECGAELDLLVEISSDSVVPVTVQHEPNGALLLQLGTPQPAHRAAPSAPTPDELKTRYGIGPSDFGQVEWTPEYLTVLEQALALLTPEERSFLSRIPIVREHRPSRVFVSPRFQEHVQALYTQRLGIARVELYDALLEDDQRLFAGSADAPMPRSVLYILHEFGHVLALAPQASAMRALVQSVEVYQGRVQELAARDSDESGTIYVTADEDAELDNKYWNIETTFDHLERMGKSGSVIAAYRSVRSSRKGPTRYGAVSAHESFAEAFAMFRGDPAALRRVDPATYSWFDRGAHLKAMAK